MYSCPLAATETLSVCVLCVCVFLFAHNAGLYHWFSSWKWPKGEWGHLTCPLLLHCELKQTLFLGVVVVVVENLMLPLNDASYMTIPPEQKPAGALSLWLHHHHHHRSPCGSLNTKPNEGPPLRPAGPSRLHGVCALLLLSLLFSNRQWSDWYRLTRPLSGFRDRL